MSLTPEQREHYERQFRAHVPVQPMNLCLLCDDDSCEPYRQARASLFWGRPITPRPRAELYAKIADMQIEWRISEAFAAHGLAYVPPPK